MRPLSTELLLEAFAEALQTMAFICPELLVEDVLAPDTTEFLRLAWTGDHPGELQLAAPRLFGELLAVNILALEPGTPEAALRARDALKELCNITAGSLLARLGDSPSDAPEMGLPTATELPDMAAWKSFVCQPDTTVLLAEGYPLALRVQESHS